MIIQTQTNHSSKAANTNGTVVAMRAIAAHLKQQDATKGNFDWIDEDIHEHRSSEILKLIKKNCVRSRQAIRRFRFNQSRTQISRSL